MLTKSKDGRRPECKACRKVSSRAEYLQNPKPGKWSKNAYLKRKYGISLDEYEELLRTQQGVCAICRAKENRSLAVDHDHKTGRVRGLLCTNCNQGLGKFRDDVDLLYASVLYLESCRSGQTGLVGNECA